MSKTCTDVVQPDHQMYNIVNGDGDISKSRETFSLTPKEAEEAIDKTTTPTAQVKTNSQPVMTYNQALLSSRNSARPYAVQERPQQTSRGSRIGAIYCMAPDGRKIQTVPSANQLLPSSSVRFNVASPSEGVPARQKDPTSWHEVYRACCCHTLEEWLILGKWLASLFGLLYMFLTGLDLLGTAFTVLGGCSAGSLLGQDTNPLASVLIGIIVTAFLQSSGTTTAIIVSLVSGGLDVKQAIYMVFGANVGTTITCMLVSLAHAGDKDELERAFGASSLYFLFNVLTLCILLPIEVTTGYLYEFTRFMLPTSVSDGDSWEGPIKKMVGPLVKTLIIANKDLIDDIAARNVESCDVVYPVICQDDHASYDTCDHHGGLIGCNSKTGRCPAFFQVNANRSDDMVSAWVCFVIALFILILCLILLVTLLRRLLAGASTHILYKATHIHPFFAMVIGCAITILVQSSSITTSVLTPLAGVGVLSFEQMYPLILGSDIGSVSTGLLASLVSSKVESLQIALVHLFFNVTGIFIWGYPIPQMRAFIFYLGRQLGKATKSWRSFPFAFIPFVFFIVPLVLMGISMCFEQGSKGYTALGSFVVIVLGFFILYALVWWRYQDGETKFYICVEQRRRRAAAIKALADDLDYLKVDNEWCKNEIGHLKDLASTVVHVPRTTICTPSAAGDEEATGLTATEEGGLPIEDDRVTLYESTHSASWQDVLHRASRSVKSHLTGRNMNAEGAESLSSSNLK